MVRSGGRPELNIRRRGYTIVGDVHVGGHARGGLFDPCARWCCPLTSRSDAPHGHGCAEARGL